MSEQPNITCNSQRAQAVGRERREFTRVPFHIEAELGLAGGGRWKARVTDLSVNGAFIEAAAPPPCGPVHIRIELLQGDPAWSVNARGAIVRSEAGQGAAVRFDELIGDQSFVHLERLVIYNAENVAATEKELQIQHGVLPGEEDFK